MIGQKQYYTKDMTDQDLIKHRYNDLLRFVLKECGDLEYNAYK